ncbi:TMEM143 family protein [Teredinibacter purpureus]|uniref:TMEM143 family protein n=1 Tax=Teredinibacter purpureus TaxID=2731756 RepID=UPI001F484DE2|nr:TMEM143 family protein [Teredinibacter purpureus]
MNNTETKAFRFIPFRVSDIVKMCLSESELAEQREAFLQFTGVLTQVFHYEFKGVLDALKEAYSPMDPDADTRSVFPVAEDSTGQFVALLKTTLEKANYQAVSDEELNRAMTNASLFDLRLHVDFNDFSEVLLFCRGQSVQQQSVSRWFGLSSKTVEFVNYDRVVVYIRFKSNESVSTLKLFQNVPQADLEMLFPNTQLRMRTQDKILIGVPAVVSGAIVLTTKVGATFLLIASMLGFWFGFHQKAVEMNATNLSIVFAGLGALGTYLWKQFSNFKNRKLRFMQQLTQNLYFKNLDNNAGVIFRLINDAQEEECKEAILAYYFLLLSDAPLSRNQLDDSIERWLVEKWGCTIDFEIDDAMAKLLRLGLVYHAQGGYTALPLKKAMLILDQRWDAYFDFT